MNSYEWRNGLKRRPECTAEEAAVELERIRKKQAGELNAKAVVEEARKKRHKFHSFFEWEDEIAGQRWREAQARTLIGGIVVKFDDKNETRAFQHVEIKGGDSRQEKPGEKRKSDGSKQARSTTLSYYTSTEDALADPEKRAYILNRALREAESWRDRYRSMCELSGVFDAIETAREEHVPEPETEADEPAHKEAANA